MDRNSLLDVFNPPKDFIGQVCVCCALSASQDFIETALERFTKNSLHDGAVSMYLMLDKSSTMLNSDRAKGLVQLQALPKKEIRIQHAKVALMQFAKVRGTSKLGMTADTIWRIVVSTGNWTLESACKNIEIVWSADFCVKKSGEERALFADVFSVRCFFDSLIRHYVACDNLLNRLKQLFGNIDSFKKKELYTDEELKTTRFFSTINKVPLWESIKSTIKPKRLKIGLVQIGSGFYEQETIWGKPDIISEIDELIGDVKPRPVKKVVVNRNFAGQLKNWNQTDGWKMYLAEDPYATEFNREFLHAKYICFADAAKKKYNIYIGSGNLSKMGLKSAFGMSPKGCKGGGNIEAGVVIEVNRATASMLLKHGDQVRDLDDLKTGTDDEDDCNQSVPVCPIVAFKKNGDVLVPEWYIAEELEVTEKSCFEIFISGKSRKTPLHSKEPWIVPNFNQASILVRWRDFDYWIPVITEDGNLIPEKVQVLSMDNFFDYLNEFPVVSKREDGPDDDDQTEDEKGGKPKSPRRKRIAIDTPVDVYPLQSSMEFIEKIARKNGLVNDDCIDDYIKLLELLVEEFPVDLREQWRSLGVNFLEVLCKKGFAPQTKKKAEWKNFVCDLSKRWNFESLETLI